VRDLEPCSNAERLDGTVLKVGRFTEKQSQALQAAQQAGSASAAPQRDARPGFTAGIDGDPAFNPFTYATDDGEVVVAAPAQPANGTGPTSTVLVNGFPLTGDRPATGMGGGGHLTSAKVAFKSKVVSRAHAEIWCEGEGKVSVSALVRVSGSNLAICTVLRKGHEIIVWDIPEPHPFVQPGNRISTVPHQGRLFANPRLSGQ
jgi:hypothetical protein